MALTTTAVVFAFMIPLGLLVRTLAQDRAMAMADQEARSVAIIVSGLHDQPSLGSLVAAADRRLPARTSVIPPGGAALGSPLPDAATDPEVARAAAGEAFSVIDADGGRVYVPVVVEEGTLVVRSAVSPGQLDDGVPQAWVLIGGLSVVLTLLALWIAARLGRSVSEPVRAVAATAHRLREGDLAARAPLIGTDETVELARALNGLAERISGLLAAERATVGDLAHRLRTPVTALRLEAEALRPPATAERIGQLIGAVQEGIDAVVREARRDIRDDLPTQADVSAEVAARVGYWTALAEDQGRALGLVLAPGPVWTRLSPTEVRDIVDVLVDNVFAHTEEGVGFRVTLTVEPGVAVLRVDDDGPGFASKTGVDHEPRVGFTGLGLDIVRRVSARAGGIVTVTGSDHPGAAVTVRLPLAQRDAGETA